MSLVKSLVSSFAACLILLSFSSAHADQITLCGQTLEIGMAAPTREIPADFSKFAGVWLGSINAGTEGTPCVAFAVRQVEQFGKVWVTQAWSDVGPNKEAGYLNWIGQIEAGSMVLISPLVSYQLRIDFWQIGNDKMSGYVVDPAGKFPVSLVRQKY